MGSNCSSQTLGRKASCSYLNSLFFFSMQVYLQPSCSCNSKPQTQRKNPVSWICSLNTKSPSRPCVLRRNKWTHRALWRILKHLRLGLHTASSRAHLTDSNRNVFLAKHMVSTFNGYQQPQQPRWKTPVLSNHRRVLNLPWIYSPRLHKSTSKHKHLFPT